ncbi:MAG: peptide chain release factor N(5)-glutamine methyltransferase [Fluviicola sp. XM-24bin1]|mgnify:CR=1 FL=1|nr:MAG: peptide chain release factor N(5)-glutamine methyltransferase [Fluviicola sp. XM-24bin1]
MFVTSNEFKAIRNYFSEELSELYAPNELKIILKFLFLKRFDATSADYILADDKRLSESDLLFFHDALKRLRKNEPFQYVIGEAEFYGLLLKCDERALIPRPETEELVDWILEDNLINQDLALLDICSGSGCIALALKSKLTEAKVTALELSTEAIDLIEGNIEFTGLNLEVIKADALTTNYEDLILDKVDVIVSNPPYIPHDDRSLMEANVLGFEPEMALFVEDDDPLIFYREIMERSQAILKDRGWLYFEIHEDLSEGVRSLFEESNFVNIELRKDLQGKDRMMRGQVVTSMHERQ